MNAFFTDPDANAADHDLARQAAAGSRPALEALVRRHQPFIYNLSLKLVLSPPDAEDLTQDILVKVITNLAGFRGQSAFRTWLYRLVMNHFLDMRRRKTEEMFVAFSRFSDDAATLENVTVTESDGLTEDQIEETRVLCTTGMLMCLDREQRLVYLLGDVFALDHRIGGELLGLTPGNYRQKLARARQDLYSFIRQKCGLVNPKNPCRCPKKTKIWLEKGLLEKNAAVFTAGYQQTIQAYVADNLAAGALHVKDLYGSLYASHGWQQVRDPEFLSNLILRNPEVTRLLKLE